jgi:hypothetical protein
MTLLISAIGLVARFAGAILTTALGWASSLLFGRVRRDRQILVVLMLAGSLLWIVLLASALAPGIPAFALAITPHPPVGVVVVRTAVLVGVVILPACVGLAAYLVPDDGDRGSPNATRRGPRS